MAQMNRNVNLEEIDSDALFGIDALRHQTILQKIIFFGCVIAGVLLDVVLETKVQGDKCYSGYALLSSGDDHCLLSRHRADG